LDTPPDGIFTSIDAFGCGNGCARRYCAINESGGIECWGKLDWVMFDIPDGIFTEISVGDKIFCGINDSGGIECTCAGGGSGGRPEVCDDQPNDTGYTQIALGRQHACALDEEGCVTCWGYDTGYHPNSGQYGQVRNTPDECIYICKYAFIWCISNLTILA
jgi:alpha-tubulin suppressor-like RCC1 family protein